MVNSVQRYAWGSPIMLEQLRRGKPPGQPDDSESAGEAPEAELWMGSHPRGPSTIVTSPGERVPLRSHLVHNTAGALGARAVSLQPPGEEEPGLPFLFKILTAEHALSIQSHPTRELATAGFRREEAAGSDRSARERNYRDQNHKPELVCAVGDFWGLRGFRPWPELGGEMDQFLELLGGSGDASVGAFSTELRTFVAAPGEDSWKRAFVSLLGLSGDRNAVATLCDAARRQAVREGNAGHGPAEERDSRYRWVLQLLDEYPNDLGALAPLYLNLVHLRRGEAMYLGAGVLHAYLYGAGVEIMANSDNVLRAGCTAKHIDPVELGRSLSFVPDVPEVIRPDPAEKAHRYETPAAEFELTTIPGAGRPIEVHKAEGPAIVLALGGMVQVQQQPEGAVISAAPTDSVFVDHETKTFTLRIADHATAYVAALPGAIQ